ncbi:nucleoside triphosphate pyrophosphohydrolase family protein [Acinetobacter tibetensis]|uniref:nucleoside triphosphate pyrophosphohydrolase family protein n=1 Tax=Acinetobacter tibetensis TaxID=2943497 RepID=UPI003A4D1F2B
MNAATSPIVFSDMVAALSKPGEMIVRELSPSDAELIHMAMGVSGEAGELLDAIKKATIYRKPMDMENVIEELGDLEFFMERIRQMTGITREQTIQANIAKLGKRYSKGTYSNDQAQVRADKRELHS